MRQFLHCSVRFGVRCASTRAGARLPRASLSDVAAVGGQTRRLAVASFRLRGPVNIDTVFDNGAARNSSATRSFSSVSASLVKLLRDRTGASMGKCRSALVEEGGDMEKAVEWLRKKGIKSMEKRQAESAEALLALSLQPSAGCIQEICAETDFVTRSQLFQQLIVSVAETGASLPSTAEGLEDSFRNAPLAMSAGADQQQLLEKAGVPVEQAVLELGSVLGERLLLGRSWRLGVVESRGVLGGYVHPLGADGLVGTGKMAAIVSLTAPEPVAAEQRARLQATAGKLARHVVAAQPRFLSVESIPADVLEKEQAVLRTAHLSQMDPGKAAKSDDNVLQKVIEGKTKKFFQDVVLLRQELILAGADSKSVPSVESWLHSEAAEIGVLSLNVEAFHFASL